MVDPRRAAAEKWIQENDSSFTIADLRFASRFNYYVPKKYMYQSIRKMGDPNVYELLAAQGWKPKGWKGPKLRAEVCVTS